MNALVRYLRTCLPASSLVDQAAALVPRLYRPTWSAEAAAEERVLSFARVVTRTNRLTVVTSELVEWLHMLQPRLRRIEASMRSLAPRFALAQGRPATSRSVSRFRDVLGEDLAVFGEAFTLHTASDWFFRRLLPRSVRLQPGGLCPLRSLFTTADEPPMTVWEDLQKMLILAQSGLDFVHAGAHRGLRRLCREIGGERMRHGGGWWRSTCETGNFHNFLEVMPAAELHLLVAAIQRKPFAVEIFSDFVRAGDSIASDDLVTHVLNDVSAAVNPMYKYLCIRFRAEEICHKISEEPSSLTAIYERLLSLEHDMEIDCTRDLDVVPLPFDVLETEMAEEFLRLGPTFWSFFQLHASSSDLRIWPLLDRMHRAASREELRSELLAFKNPTFRFFLERLIRRNRNGSSSLNLRDALVCLDLRFVLSDRVDDLLRRIIEYPSAPLCRVDAIPVDRRECCVCLDAFDERTKKPVLLCGAGRHVLCSSCVDAIVATRQRPRCPMCRRDVPNVL